MQTYALINYNILSDQVHIINVVSFSYCSFMVLYQGNQITDKKINKKLMSNINAIRRTPFNATNVIFWTVLFDTNKHYKQLNFTFKR